MTIILLILTNHLFFLFSYLGKICDSKELKLKIKLFKTNQMVLQIKIFFVHLTWKNLPTVWKNKSVYKIAQAWTKLLNSHVIVQCTMQIVHCKF